MSADGPPQKLWGVFLRGILMGAADIVPGVSGGTMAFITGIYDRLLGAIAAFDLELLRLLRARRLAQAWRHVDGAFLAALGAGILCSIFSLARLITALLEAHPLLLWSFFFGLILGSAVLLVRRVQHWRAPSAAGLLLGSIAAALIAVSPAFALEPSLPGFFIAGFFAICAMILPGVSGSFLLLLMGMYAPMLAAIDALHALPLLLFAAGAGCGLLAFSRLLHYLLSRHHSATMATLTGFLLGSLLIVWPWKAAVADNPELLRPVLPGSFAAAGADPRLLACCALMALGLGAVWLLETRWGGPER